MAVNLEYSSFGMEGQMKLQQVLSYVRKAVDDYHMIQNGDKIAVGISGGKDSLTLLYALNNLKRFYPEHFEIPTVKSFHTFLYAKPKNITHRFCILICI